MNSGKRKKTGTANGYSTKSEVIEEAIKRGIRKGLYVDRLPSVFALAEELHVNFKTVHKAVVTLVKAGILESSRGRGTFVTPKGAELVEQLGSGEESGERLVLFFMKAGGDLYGRMYECMVSRLNKAHLFPVVIREGNESDILRSLGRLNPAALVIDREFKEFPYELLQKMDKGDLRIVFLHRMESDLQIHADYVLSDNVYGGYIATRHLIELGHERILHLNVKLDPLPPPMIYRHTPASQVAEGYRLALQEANLQQNERCIFEAADKKDSQEKLRAALADPATRPTAIFAHGDFRIVNALGIIKEFGLKVPEDIALVGYYNTSHCEHFEVPLTSVSIREDELARIAAEKIISRSTDRERILVKPTLVIRQSSGAK